MNYLEFILDLGISAVLTTLREAIKNPERKLQVRRVMLKLYTQIGIVFGADDDFIDAAKKNHELV